MKNKIKLLSIAFFLSLSVQAQMSYYYKGEKISLTVNKTNVYLIADEEFIGSSRANRLFESLNIERSNGNSAQSMVKLTLRAASDEQEYASVVETLRQDAQIKHVLPFFERGEYFFNIFYENLFVFCVNSSFLCKN